MNEPLFLSRRESAGDLEFLILSTFLASFSCTIDLRLPEWTFRVPRGERCEEGQNEATGRKAFVFGKSHGAFAVWALRNSDMISVLVEVTTGCSSTSTAEQEQTLFRLDKYDKRKPI